MVSNTTLRNKLCASNFVDNLLKEGSLIRCDETNNEFKRTQPPPFYDPERFKRGQQFFYKHIFAIFFAKILGLVTILSVPDLSRVLKFTKRSETPITAYKRYLSTIFHMVVWYDYDLTPQSKIWKSLEKVKFKHNAASNRCCSAGLASISQKNMALTQFGFMGYTISETETVGVYNASIQELEDFIYVWRVIGYLLGMEDRFNICRDSLEETREICHELIRRIFQPEVKKQHEDYINLTHSLVTGMWCMMPVMNHNVFLYFINDMVTKYKCANTNNNNNIKDNEEEKNHHLNIFQRFYLFCMVTFFSLMKYTAFRVFHVCNMHMVFWLMHNFPFLAYYKFGKENSHIDIFNE